MQAFIKCKMNQEHYAKHCGRCQAAGQEKSAFAAREAEKKEVDYGSIFLTSKGQERAKQLRSEREQTKGQSPFYGIFVDPEMHQKIIESGRA